MRIRAVVLLGAVLTIAVVLGVVRGRLPSDSVIPDSSVRDTAQTGFEQRDSIRLVRAVVRKRVADSDTYLGYALTEDDSVFKRWEDRTVRMLTVHVSANPEGNRDDGPERSPTLCTPAWICQRSVELAGLTVVFTRYGRRPAPVQ